MSFIFHPIHSDLSFSDWSAYFNFWSNPMTYQLKFSGWMDFSIVFLAGFIHISRSSKKSESKTEFEKVGNGLNRRFGTLALTLKWQIRDIFNNMWLKFTQSWQKPTLHCNSFKNFSLIPEKKKLEKKWINEIVDYFEWISTISTAFILQRPPSEKD